MKRKGLFSILFIAIYISANATIYYTANSVASFEGNNVPATNWTTNPNGTTGITNPIITENDEIVLLNGAVVYTGDVTVNKLTVNGNASMIGTGQLIVRLTTTLNAGILLLDDIELQLGNGDNNTSAGKILGTPNGTTIGIDASSNYAYITLRGGMFTSYSAANVVTIPNGTFIGNTVVGFEVNMFSIFGFYQVELNTALPLTREY